MAKRIISYSEIDTAKQCGLKHQLGYVERWSKPQPPDSALSKGTAWHLVMETHYNVLKNGGDLDACVLAVTRKIEGLDDSLQGLVWWMYQGYVAHYGADPEWQILAVEHNAVCRLPTPRGTPSSFYLKVKIDLVVRNRRTRNILVVDHKSGKDLPGQKMLELDDQFGLYTWAMRQIGKKVFGQVYNAARTYRLQADVTSPGATPLDERFRRVPLYRTDKELEATVRDTYLLASARYRDQAAANRMGVMSARSTNPETCQWRCDYKDACLAGRKGISIQGFLHDTGFEQSFERH
jgi:hypothetical protein